MLNPAPELDLNPRRPAATTPTDEFASLPTPWGLWLNRAVVVLVVTACGLFVAETYSWPEPTMSRLQLADRVILGLFAGEYLLRLGLAPQKRRYLFSFYSLVDLLAILPLGAGVADTRFFRSLRLLRSLRVLRLARFWQGKMLWGGVRGEDGAIATRLLFTLLSIIFVFAGLIYQVEHGQTAAGDKAGFANFFDAFYFAVVTMTTVGYGDLTPVSEAGRLLTVLMILTGIAVIPAQLGELLRRLRQSPTLLTITCSGCGWSLHEQDANFCRRCGTSLQPLEPPDELG